MKNINDNYSFDPFLEEENVELEWPVFILDDDIQKLIDDSQKET